MTVDVEYLVHARSGARADEEHATGAIGFDGVAVLLEAQGAARAGWDRPGREALEAIALARGRDGKPARRARPPRGTTPDLHRAVLAGFLASVQDGRGPSWTARPRSGSRG